MAARSMEHIGMTIVHYLKLSLEQQGIRVTADMADELNDIADSFTNLDRALSSTARSLHALSTSTNNPN